MADVGELQVWDLQHPSVFRNLQLLASVQGLHSLGVGVQADTAALLSVIFGHVVCQPVHFGFPALP